MGIPYNSPTKWRLVTRLLERVLVTLRVPGQAAAYTPKPSSLRRLADAAERIIPAIGSRLRSSRRMQLKM